MPPVRTNAKSSSSAAFKKAAKSSKPIGVTKVTKSRGKLSGFAEMPKKVQQRIWEFAASPGGTMKLTGHLFQSNSNHGHLFKRLSKKNINYFVDRKLKWSTTIARANANARTNLKSVCSLSRLVAREAWQKDIAAIPTCGSAWALKTEVAKGKAETNDLLIGLIANLKSEDDNRRAIQEARHLSVAPVRVAKRLPRFAELDANVQKRIWWFAARPRGAIHLTTGVLKSDDWNGKNFFQRVSSQHLPHNTNLDGVLKSRLTANARTKLMGVCALSRLVVLETWEKDVASLDWPYWRHYGDGWNIDNYDYQGGRAIVNKLLGGLISDLMMYGDRKSIACRALDAPPLKTQAASSVTLLSLPKEIQMIIWEYAANPRGPADLHKSFFPYLKDEVNFERNFFADISKNDRAYCSRHLYYGSVEETLRNRATVHARSKLTGVCTLSREIVLRIWKKEVADLVCRVDRPALKERASVFASNTTQVLDRLIMQLKRDSVKRT